MTIAKTVRDVQDIVTDACIDIRQTLDRRRDREIKGTIAGMLHEVTRELQYIEQTARIYQSLKTKSHARRTEQHTGGTD